jgi:hypothetical protein
MKLLGHAAPSLTAVLIVGLVTPLWAQAPTGQKPVRKAAAAKFVRIVHDEDKDPVALETATVRYVSASGEGDLVVDLIGVVHIGDREYYKKLNKQFQQYDVLLYELVAPQGARVPKGGKSDNPLAMVQGLMKSVLALESQTELIDYSKKNFVHADLSPSEMAEAIKKRGDTGVTLALSIAADLLRQQNLQEQNKPKANGKQEPDLDLLSMLFDPDAAVKMKRMMAGQLAAMTAGETGLGPTLNTILISDRNAAAMKVFQKELAQGRKKIGIFYGAAHMPDFDRRLREEFALRMQSTHWLTAWDMRIRPRGGLEELLKQLLP